MLKILQNERDFLFCVKPAGVESEHEMPQLLKRQLNCPDIFCVHRLDQPVGGVMIFAKNGKTAAQLSELFAKGPVEKKYLALCEGVPPGPKGVWQDLLFHDRRTNKTFVVNSKRNGVKEAMLSYRLLSAQTPENGAPVSLLLCELHSGRSHQIRVQLASRKLPILGDRRYGSRLRIPAESKSGTKEEIALWSCALRLSEPKGGKSTGAFQLPPKDGIWSIFSQTIDNYCDRI